MWVDGSAPGAWGAYWMGAGWAGAGWGRNLGVAIHSMATASARRITAPSMPQGVRLMC